MSPITGKKRKNIRVEGFLDPWQLKRKHRIAFIMKLLESLKEVDVNKFLGLMSTEHGIRRKTLEEYLQDLQDYGVIEVGDGKIKWVGKKSEEA